MINSINAIPGKSDETKAYLILYWKRAGYQIYDDPYLLSLISACTYPKGNCGLPEDYSNTRFQKLLDFDDELIAIAANLPDHVNTLLDKIHAGPLVIAHGDVRLDNIFFDDDGIALVDYQAVCKASPEHDLAYFVTQSLADDVRHSEDWHSVYFDELTCQGIDYDKAYSYKRYRLCAMYFLCYSVIIAGTLDPANQRGRKLAETLLGNSIRSLKELNALELIA